MPNNNSKGGAQWAPAHVDALRAYMQTPGKSFVRIASLLNEQFGTSFTRNSTIGKASRLGLKSLNASGVNLAGQRPRKIKDGLGKRKYVRATHNSTQALRIVREVEIEKLRCIDLAPLNKSLVENGGCWYPTGGEAPLHLFCGHPKRSGSSYCTGHHFLCWMPPQARRDVAYVRAAA